MNSEFENEGVKPSLDLRLIPLRGASGGTCNVYSSRLFGKKVFVKEIKPELADDARMLAAFRKEAEIGFRIDHPNLPKYVFAEGVLPSEKYIVQEFIDGPTLPDFIKENPAYFRNKKNLTRLLSELADVIDYLHQNGIVHLDLKPENIIITRVGHTLKLVDLGFCSSDFYDDTRGFTRSGLAPEGVADPRDRGVESDYYGIGKILNYIRSHTPGLSGREFRKLESRLLQPDTSKRLSSKEGIEKILAGNVRAGRAWLAAVSTLIVLALVLFLILDFDKDSSNAPAGEKAENHDLPAVTEPEPNNTEIAGNTHLAAEENLPPQKTQKQEYNNLPQSEFSYDSYERLKAEMRGEINKNFASFEKKLTDYLRDGNFTEKDYKTVIDTYNTALQKTLETGPYKAKYKDLSPSLIDDTMAEQLQQIEKTSWGPAYKNYIQECQAFSEGSSR